MLHKVNAIYCHLCRHSVFAEKQARNAHREASEGVEYDFYFTEYDFYPEWSRILIFTHCPIKLIYLW
jgi:hypothetical protein